MFPFTLFDDVQDRFTLIWCSVWASWGLFCLAMCRKPRYWGLFSGLVAAGLGTLLIQAGEILLFLNAQAAVIGLVGFVVAGLQSPAPSFFTRWKNLFRVPRLSLLAMIGGTTLVALNAANISSLKPANALALSMSLLAGVEAGMLILMLWWLTSLWKGKGRWLPRLMLAVGLLLHVGFFLLKGRVSASAAMLVTLAPVFSFVPGTASPLDLLRSIIGNGLLGIMSLFVIGVCTCLHCARTAADWDKSSPSRRRVCGFLYGVVYVLLAAPGLVAFVLLLILNDWSVRSVPAGPLSTTFLQMIRETPLIAYNKDPGLGIRQFGQPWNESAAKTSLLAAAKAIDLLRTHFRRGDEPIPLALIQGWRRNVEIPFNQGLRLSEYLVLEGDLAMMQGHTEAALASYLDCVYLGRMLERDANLLGALSALQVANHGYRNLAALWSEKRLTSQQVEQLLHVLAGLENQSVTPLEVALSERNAMREKYGWRQGARHLLVGDNSQVYGDNSRFYKTMHRLFLAELAKDVYTAKRGRPPAMLQDLPLAPHLLIDPYALPSAPFRLRSQDGQMKLYSVGPDGKDNEGQVSDKTIGVRSQEDYLGDLDLQNWLKSVKTKAPW